MKKTNLFEKICKTDFLWSSWIEIKAKNTAGGIDKISIEDFNLIAKSEIDQLVLDLKSGDYLSLPYKKVQIPKDKSSFRELGLLSVRDKIVQHAVNSLIEPIINKQLTASCYAYRKGKGAVFQPLKQSDKIIKLNL